MVSLVGHLEMARTQGSYERRSIRPSVRLPYSMSIYSPIYPKIFSEFAHLIFLKLSMVSGTHI